MMQAASRVLRATRRHWHRLNCDEKGSTLTILAVLPVLAGAAAIGIETGELYRVKRQMQGSADAAALSGSIDKMAGKTNTVVEATARYEAQRNGFTNGANNVTVTVNSPPTSGSNTGTTGAVEVIVRKTMRFSLGAVLVNWLGGTNSTFTISARSVAAQGTVTTTTTGSTTTYSGCMVALTTNPEQGLSLSSFNNFDSDCALMSNGSATGSGSGASVNITTFNNATMSQVWTRGSYTASSYLSVSPTPANALTSQSGYAIDPYAGLGTPSPGTCTYNNYTPPNGSNVTLSPGTYCGGLTITGKSNVHFQAGTYYIANGDLVIQSDNNVDCSTCSTNTGSVAGITFVLTQTTGNNANIGGVSITAMNTVSLNAPATGTYAGVLFYQDRRANVGMMSDTSRIFTLASLNTATLAGAIYFPNNKIEVSNINNYGGSKNDGCTIWVGRYIKFSGYNNNYKGGCDTYNTTPVGYTSTTTTTSNVSKAKVVE